MKNFLISPSVPLFIVSLLLLSTTIMGCSTLMNIPKATPTAQQTMMPSASSATTSIPITTKTKAEHGIGTPITISADNYAKIKDLVTPIREFYTGNYWLELTDADLEKIPEEVQYRLQKDAFMIDGIDPLLGQPDIPLELQAAPAGDDVKGLYLLQYYAVGMSDWVKKIKAMDVDQLSNYGGTKYLVWATPNQLKTAQEQFDFIRAWAPFHAKYKINPRLLEQTGVIDWVNVVYYTDSNPQTTIDAITSLGGEIKKASAWDGPGYNEGHIQTKIDASKLSELARLPQVMSLYKGAEDTFDE